jgi:hypothetical protein
MHIEPFTLASTAEASRTLARAFVTNPLHVVAFGPERLARNEAFFRTGLAAMKGPKLVALEGSQILGLIHWVPSLDCQFSGPEKLRMMPAMVAGFGLRSSLRVGSWLSAWSKHDPSEPHSHLGPIGVDPSAQGQGIGRQLMERYCAELDRTETAGYFEKVLDLRPVYHRREDRIRAHVVLCWLALLLVRVIETSCEGSWPSLRHELEKLRLGSFQGAAGSFCQRSEITAAQRVILARLQLREPPLLHELTPAAT